MTPTNRLRFVEREETKVIERHATYEVGATIKVRVLQQWWEVCLMEDDKIVNRGEWRDVPLVVE